MNYTLLRNATGLLAVAGHRFLIDPMLDPKDARPPVANTPNQHPNPLVELPVGWEDLVANVDALIITHLHKDHFDDTAALVIDHDLPLFGQPEDRERLEAAGFRAVLSVDPVATIGEITLTRTAGQHGTGEIGRQMEPVSGFVLDAPNESRVYLAGDTVWCPDVQQAIRTHQPDVIVLNAGGARFLEGDPIVMTAEDIAHVHQTAPEALLIVVHLEAINHCLESRRYYRDTLPTLGIPLDRIRIPEDDEGVIW